MESNLQNPRKANQVQVSSQEWGIGTGVSPCPSGPGSLCDPCSRSGVWGYSPCQISIPPVPSVILFVSHPDSHLQRPNLIPVLYLLVPCPHLSPLSPIFCPSSSEVVISQFHLCLSLSTGPVFPSPLRPASFCFSHSHRLILSLTPFAIPQSLPICLLQLFSPGFCGCHT